MRARAIGRGRVPGKIQLKQIKSIGCGVVCQTLRSYSLHISTEAAAQRMACSASIERQQLALAMNEEEVVVEEEEEEEIKEEDGAPIYFWREEYMSVRA